ncbi:unnamed protein product [Parnassius mnemosyne]|uniref:Transposase n=1 Tax=Parnassius mnemosyne TaxID=213953 RepID=A0AAV1LFN7_9NEOP
MPSVYRRKPGSRRYVDYTQADLKKCLDAIQSKVLTQRAAAELFNIPRSTLKNKLTRKHPNKPGKPTIFTEEEEKAFEAHITALWEYGFPLTAFDLKMIIKNYLESQGRVVKIFKNNIPGKDWLASFLSRHQSLSRRLANNIKRVRAQVSEDVISNFIENIDKELESVPPENIFNYDESNLCDDPGKKTILCRRGTKYPETIVNATKVNFTVMFCGNAAGETIPPFIVYKSDHLWSTWTENGPEGARYNRTKSGWMDSATFEDWFLNHLMPVLKKKNGRKVVIGDNLASHINKTVLNECEKHNVSFICLPPNATHILQPLDVAYFRPLKCKWRQVLLQWKNSQLGRKLSTTPKDQFPRLLKTALDSLTETKANLIAGFRKTGIYPIDKEEPLPRLPKQDRIINAGLIGNSFMHTLVQYRAEACPEPKTIRKKKLNVPPGKSICATDLAEAGPSGLQQAKTIKEKKRATKRRQRNVSSSSSCSDRTISLASSTEDHIMPYDSEDDVLLANYVSQISDTDAPTFRHSPDLQQESEVEEECGSPVLQVIDVEQQLFDVFKDFTPIQSIEGIQIVEEKCSEREKMQVVVEDCQDKNLRVSPARQIKKLPQDTLEPPGFRGGSLDLDVVVGNHVLVTWNSRKYPGKVLAVSEEGAFITCMKKGKMYWRWPTIKDEQLYGWDHILCKIGPPKLEKKGCFSVPEMNV